MLAAKTKATKVCNHHMHVVSRICNPAPGRQHHNITCLIEPTAAAFQSRSLDRVGAESQTDVSGLAEPSTALRATLSLLSSRGWVLQHVHASSVTYCRATTEYCRHGNEMANTRATMYLQCAAPCNRASASTHQIKHLWHGCLHRESTASMGSACTTGNIHQIYA